MYVVGAYAYTLYTVQHERSCSRSPAAPLKSETVILRLANEMQQTNGWRESCETYICFRLALVLAYIVWDTYDLACSLHDTTFTKTSNSAKFTVAFERTL